MWKNICQTTASTKRYLKPTALHKENPIDIYLLLFLLIVLIGSVTVYIYYLKEKKEQLDAINRGFCPKCKQKSIILTDQRSGGCGGPKIVSFECESCGYHNSFSIDTGSGCGGSCGH